MGWEGLMNNQDCKEFVLADDFTVRERKRANNTGKQTPYMVIF